MPITTDGHGHVALVKMDRPDAMNGLDRAYNHALAEALLALAADDDEVRCVVVTGADLHDLLPRCVPLGIILEMAIIADPFTVEAALRWGLVNRVVEGHDLVDAGTGLAAFTERLEPDYSGR